MLIAEHDYLYFRLACKFIIFYSEFISLICIYQTLDNILSTLTNVIKSIYYFSHNILLLCRFVYLAFIMLIKAKLLYKFIDVNHLNNLHNLMYLFLSFII
mgnify:CR=1 FL=1